MSQPGFETLQLRGGYHSDPATGASSVPLYQTTAYVYPSAEHAASVFLRQTPGYVYSRIDNPTVDVLEQRIALLEKGKAAVAFASGQAALMGLVNALCVPGDEIVSASSIYGGTYTLFSARLPQCTGVKCHFVDQDDFTAIERAITDKTRFIFIEILGNPGMNIPDIEKIAALAHRNGLPLVCDNTFATPYLVTVKDFGVAIVTTSLTKYMNGNGTTVGGAVIDLGTFDWNNPRFPRFTEGDPSNHGLVYAPMDAPLAAIVRTQILRDMGACLAPFNAFMILHGMETLSLRMERHCQNAQKVAEFLQNHEKVSFVNYPGLSGNRYHDRKQKYLPNGVGGILSFGVKGGLEAGRRFINSLKFFLLLANVADSKSCVVHPATTTHGQLNEEELKQAGIQPELIRLSIGLESIEDILADLEQALEKV